MKIDYKKLSTKRLYELYQESEFKNKDIMRELVYRGVIIEKQAKKLYEV